MNELPSRRAFIATAAAAAVAAPAVAQAAALQVSQLSSYAASVGTLEAAVFSEGVTLPEKHPWKWWAGDGEKFCEWFEKAEDAIAFAKSEGHSTVAECRQGDYDLTIRTDWLHEHWYSMNEDRMDPDGDGMEFLHKVTDSQFKDLQEMLTGVAYAWALKHGIDVRAWCFTGVRNETHVPEEGEGGEHE